MTADAGRAVLLTPQIADAIVAHALGERPNEACGVVVGSAPLAEGGVALRYVPCRNQAASPTRYVIHRDDLLGVLVGLDRDGGDLWGVVHSHVRSAAIPSATDIGEATWPAAVYLLVSLAGEPEIRAWRIDDGEATELPLAIGEP